MSYSIEKPCYNCKKQEGCTDHVHIEKAVNKIHEHGLSDVSGHMGSGSIIINCHRIDAKDK